MENNWFRARFVNKRGANQVLRLNNNNLEPPLSDIIIGVKSCGVKKITQELSEIQSNYH